MSYVYVILLKVATCPLPSCLTTISPGHRPLCQEAVEKEQQLRGWARRLGHWALSPDGLLCFASYVTLGKVLPSHGSVSSFEKF